MQLLKTFLGRPAALISKKKKFKCSLNWEDDLICALYHALSLEYLCLLTRAQPGFFLGGAEVIEAKSVEKEKVPVIRIAKEKLGGPSN